MDPAPNRQISDERTPLVGAVADDNGDPVPSHVEEGIALMVDFLGDNETQYGLRQPIHTTAQNIRNLPATVIKNLTVPNVLPNGSKRSISVPKLVLKGLVMQFPRQIIDQVPELAQIDALIGTLEEARSNPVVRQIVAEWFRNQTATINTLKSANQEDIKE